MTAIPNVTEAGYFGWGVFLADRGESAYPYACVMIRSEAELIARAFNDYYEPEYEVRQLPEPEWNR